MIALVLCAGMAASPAPPQLDAAVHRFYSIVIKHRPLGLPSGEVRTAMWPLLSARLSERLVLLEECERDYYAGNRARLESQQLKPAVPWLEYGLFSGGNEEALPVAVRILQVSPDGVRTRVHLEFTYRDTYETYGRSPDDSNTFRWKGVLVLVQDADRYLVDDYVPVDDDTGQPLTPLSADFPECKAGRWVGAGP